MKTLLKGLIYTAIISILSMVVFGFAESWSQNHTGPYDYFLYATLGCIYGTFLLLGANEKGGNRFYDWLTAILFLGVLVFGVNSKFYWVEIMHLVFTGLAIVSTFLNAYHYYNGQKIMRQSIVLSALVTLPIFYFLAYKGTTLTIAMGELIVAIPATILVFVKIKKLK